MRKLLQCTILIPGLIIVLGIQNPTKAQNQNLTIPYISTEMTIDGVIDDWPLTINYTPLEQYINKTTDWLVQGEEWSSTPFDASDLSAQMLVGYDIEYFYLFLEVIDDIDAKQDAKYKSDDVELFFNPDPGNDLPYDGSNKNYTGSDGVTDALQITFGRDTAEFEAGPGWIIRDWDYEYAIVNQTNSYTFEIKIPWDSLFTDHTNIGDWTPDRTPLVVSAEPGYSMGFDIMIIDYDGNTTFDDFNRDGHLHWANESGIDLAYRNTGLFGTITLDPNTSTRNLKTPEISAFPSPFTDIITIDGLKTGMDVKVFNVLGQKVHDSEIRNSGSKLNLGHLDKGIYLLTIYYKNGLVSSSKIIKK